MNKKCHVGKCSDEPVAKYTHRENGEIRYYCHGHHVNNGFEKWHHQFDIELIEKSKKEPKNVTMSKEMTPGENIAASIRPFMMMPPENPKDLDKVIADIAKGIDNLLVRDNTSVLVKRYESQAIADEKKIADLMEQLHDKEILLDACKSAMKSNTKEFVEWITSKDSKYSIMYGGTPELEKDYRFAAIDIDFTIDEVYDHWLQYLRKKQL